MVEQVFQPRTLTIKVGTEVTWTNTACKGGCTVTFEDIKVDSGPMAIGATFKHTFKDPGTFQYICQLMPNYMWGTIFVIR
jgi:plastocyanin